ncbi:FxsC protein [Catenulispora rubra]|uniref:FxsC protein n=1 Tax=Catenulispora rubra TaxID=280293 RepID=UPI0018920FCC|nr:FxsC protein [Catenulispora rubra]
MAGSRQSGDEPSVHEPLFFLSYARPHEAEAERPREELDLFLTFFDDLTQQISTLLPRKRPGDLGYAAPADAPERPTLQALSVCHVFVPLISPQYFSTRRCGLEWSAFRKRVRTRDVGLHFVPVTWAPVEPADIPPDVLEVDFHTPREGRADIAEGLYPLMVDRAPGSDYDLVVRNVARTISCVVREHPLPAGVLPSLLGQQNAFRAAPTRLLLRIVILAPTRDRSPKGRTADGHYGDAQTDWAPYGDRRDRTLAADVRTIADRLGYAPEIVGFDDVAPALLAGTLSSAPTVLLIDNWALLDTAWRDQVAAYADPAAKRPDWETFMVVRDDHDPQTRQRGADLRAAVDETLAASLRAMQTVVEHAASGNGPRERFPSHFSTVAEFAAGLFRFRRSR